MRTKKGDRSQSELVAVVLLVGMVSVSSILILLAGGIVVDDSQQHVETDKVEQGFRSLDNDIDSVAYGGTDAAQTDLDLRNRDGGTVEYRDTGRIVVTVNDSDGSSNVIDRSMGTIVYTDDRTTVGYQSNAVWRGTGNGTQLLSAPRVQYKPDHMNDPTLSLIITEIRGDLGATDSAVSVERGPGSPETNNVTDVGNKAITIRITSQFYVGWANYFRSILPGGVSVNHGTNTTIVRLVPASKGGGIPAGIVQTSSAEDLVLGQQIDTDSYNSAKGSYPSGGAGDGTVLAAGDVDIDSNLVIDGDVITGGYLNVSQKATIKGDVKVGGNLSLRQPNSNVEGGATYSVLEEETGTIGGSKVNRSDTYVPSEVDIGLPASDSYIAAAEEEYSTGSPESFPACTSGCTVDAGEYHFDEIDLKNDGPLTLDTTDGDISIFVDGPVRLEGTDVNIVGQGTVNIFVDSSIPGAGNNEHDFVFRQGDISAPGDDSTQFWVYVRSDADAELGGGGGGPSHIDGVVYGASGDTSESGARIDLNQKAEVFGALVGSVKEVKSDTYVHFDRALLGKDPAPTGIPAAKWLHVLVRVADVETK